MGFWARVDTEELKFVCNKTHLLKQSSFGAILDTFIYFNCAIGITPLLFRVLPP